MNYTKLNVDVVDGGECLYIYPIAYHIGDAINQNQLILHTLMEHNLYENQFVFHFDDYNDLIDKVSWLRIQWVRFKHALKTTWQHNKLDVQYWAWTFRIVWSTTTFLTGEDVFYYPIPSKSSPMILPNTCVDNTYLIPSQSYLRGRVNDWLDAQEGMDDYDDIRDEYRAWSSNWRAKGCKIGFVSALDS